MKCLIVYNPYSGNGRMERYVEDLKRKYSPDYKEIVLFTPFSPGSITKYIRNNVHIYSLLVICGGDGTFNEALNGIMQAKRRPPIVYFPTGTCNDIGRLLGIRHMSIRKEIKNSDEWVFSKMDVCRCGERYFTYASAFGKFTEVSYTAPTSNKKVLGRGAYFYECFKYLPKKSEIDLTLNANGKTVTGKYNCVLALNTQNVAGMHFYRFKPCKINDGLMDVTLIKRKNMFSLLNLGMFFILGDVWKTGVENITTSKVSIKTKQEVIYNLDGERAFKTNQSEIEVIKQAIEIKMSKKSYDKYCK